MSALRGWLGGRLVVLGLMLMSDAQARFFYETQRRYWEGPKGEEMLRRLGER